ncbi:hypothetical protein D6825_01695, partial [Candidatus Woesearchaeota archaeon]
KKRTMSKDSARLVAFGFAKGNTIQIGDKTYKIEGKTPEDKLERIKKIIDEVGDEDKVYTALEKIANQEEIETVPNQISLSSYPKPANQFQAHLESYQKSIEHYYYWSLNFLGDIGFVIVDKITDSFSASEQSSFYGAGMQRLGLAQDRAGQFLATIGKMIKDLFQLVRELRWIDERLEIYRAAFGVDKKGKKTEEGPQESAEVTLKGLWVDLVDGVVGGQRTGSNLFTMAQQLQFSSLPDLFFGIHPRNIKDVDKIVDEKAHFANKQVRLALKRKLAQYLAWKKATFDEIKTRRKFTVQYLRQHYNVIKMYIQWVKPYIKHIERLSLQQDLLNNPRLVSAFESSLVEIEIIARTRSKKTKGVWNCVMIHFEYHTKPSLQYSSDGGYHRGPIHVGTTRITWRGYSWTDEQLENYKKMRAQEDLEILTSIDKTLKEAMDQLGQDVWKYLEEAEGKKKEEKKEEKKKPTTVKDLMEPFSAIAKGFGETLSAMMPKISKKEKAKKPKTEEGTAGRYAFLHYNVFKKANGMLSW